MSNLFKEYIENQLENLSTDSMSLIIDDTTDKSIVNWFIREFKYFDSKYDIRSADIISKMLEVDSSCIKGLIESKNQYVNYSHLEYAAIGCPRLFDLILQTISEPRTKVNLATNVAKLSSKLINAVERLFFEYQDHWDNRTLDQVIIDIASSNLKVLDFINPSNWTQDLSDFAIDNRYNIDDIPMKFINRNNVISVIKNNSLVNPFYNIQRKYDFVDNYLITLATQYDNDIDLSRVFDVKFIESLVDINVRCVLRNIRENHPLHQHILEYSVSVDPKAITSIQPNLITQSMWVKALSIDPSIIQYIGRVDQIKLNALLIAYSTTQNPIILSFIKLIDDNRLLTTFLRGI